MAVTPDQLEQALIYFRLDISAMISYAKITDRDDFNRRLRNEQRSLARESHGVHGFQMARI